MHHAPDSHARTDGREPAPNPASPVARRGLLTGAAAGVGIAAVAGSPAAASSSAASSSAASSAAVSSSGRSVVRSRGFSRATTDVLGAIIGSGAGAANLPGLNVGVWVPGRGSFVQSIGTSDLSTGAPLALEDHFRIASISKTFTATVVLRLVDRGLLRLDDRLETFVPGIPRGDEITVAQLLGMRAGLFDFTDDDDFVAAYAADPLIPFGLGELRAIIDRHEPLFAPGTEVRYSNSSYYLLGAIAEQVTGRPMRQLVRREVTRPLGLSGTSYPQGPDLPAPFSRGYVFEAASVRDMTAGNPDVPGGAGAMISTLRDLRLWARALATGRLLDPATHRLALRTRVLAQSPRVTIRYGLGIADFNGFLGHDGAIFGYGSTMLYLPRRDATIVALANAGGVIGNPAALFIALGVAAHLFPEQFPEGLI